jgi:hypothetical protein
MAFIVAPLIDTALSFAFAGLSQIIFPRTQPKSQDSIPNGDYGAPLFWGWGFFICPGTLCYILEPNLNNRVQLNKNDFADPEDASSYAHFLIVNPDGVSIKALRINGAIVATSIPELPLDTDNKSNQISDIQTGGTRFDNVTYRFYDGTQAVTDPIFVKQNLGDLIYKGQSYIAIDSALRSLYGGRGSALTAYLENAIESSVNLVPYKGFGDNLVKIQWQYPNGYIANVPRGFQKYGSFATFDGANSLLPINIFTGLGAQTNFFIIGTDSEFWLNGNEGGGFQIVGNSTDINPPGVAGKYSIAFATYNGNAYTSYNVLTDKVLVCKLLGTVREVTVPLQYSPFYSFNGQIYNFGGAPLAAIGLDEKVVGWGGKMLKIGSPTLQNNTTPNTNPPTSNTTLIRIFDDMFLEKDITRVTYLPGFNENILGFSTKAEDFSRDILNLLMAFNKVVYENKAGYLVFDAYPTNPTFIDIPVDAHVSEMELTINSEYQLIDSINFSYRDISRQLDSSTIKIGGNNNNPTDLNLELVLSPQQAPAIAWRIRNRLRGSYITGTLHLGAEYNFIENNDVLKILALTSYGIDLKVLVTRVEVGANLTLAIQFVNWVELETYFPYQVDFTDSTPPVITAAQNFILLDTEPRSNSSAIGLNYYIDFNSTLVTTDLSSILNSQISFVLGTLTAIDFSTGKAILTIVFSDIAMNLEANTDYYLGDSWISAATVILKSPGTYEITNVSIGKYGSSDKLVLNKKIYQLFEYNVFNNSYASYSATAGTKTATLSPATKKRIYEPQLSEFSVNAHRLVIRRKQLRYLDDGNLGNLNYVAPVTVYYRVTNMTTNATGFYTISSNSTAISYPNYVPGDIIRLQLTDSSNNLLTNSFENFCIAI